MANPRKKTEERTFYVQTCERCGKDFEVTRDNKTAMCYDCQTAIAREKAMADGQFLLGAVIIAFEPKSHGHLTGYDELDSVTVRTQDGRTIELTGGGYDERCIEWEETER